MSQILYISRVSCEEVSQIVFFSMTLTVLQAFYKCKEKCHKSHISASSCAQVSQIVFLAVDLTVLHGLFYNCMKRKMSQNSISPRALCTRTNRRVRWFERFTAYYNCISKMVTYSESIVHKYLVFIAYFIVLYLSFRKMSQNSYLREFCAQVSHVVFLVDLTVLQLITTVWGKLSQNFYLPEFIEKVSQIVFLAYFTVLRLFTTMKKKCHKSHIYASSVHKYHKSCS